MREIIKRNSGLAEFMPDQRLKPDTVYRWSDFVFSVEKDDKSYIYNTFTKQCFETDTKLDKDKLFSADEIESRDDLKTLLEGHFIVPEDKDESAVYEKIISLLRVYKRKNGYTSYTILPTTACNARCIYCYEEDMKQVTMTPEIVDDTISFIIKTHRKDEAINLSWFGGEPLIGEGIIDKICAALKEIGVEYRSSMITNASLMTDENIEKMRGEWNMKQIQVSLDGTEGEYIRRKNYCGSSEGIYKRVLENITKLKGIPVILRCNMDEDNIDDVCEFIDELDRALPDKSNIGLNIVPLYGVQSRADGIAVWEKCVGAWEYGRKAGFKIPTGLGTKELRLYRCMADNPHGSVVIAPDGSLYNCEHCEPGMSFGNIWEGTTEPWYVKDFERVERTDEKCQGCVFLPECTSFSRCPVKNASCRYAMKMRLTYSLMGVIQKERTNETQG